MPARDFVPAVVTVEAVPATDEVSEVSSCTEYCSRFEPPLSPSPPGLALNHSIASCTSQCSVS